MQNRMRAISEIVSILVAGVKAGKDVDLNAVKRDINSKYALARAPKLVEIISALPEEHRAELLPQYVSVESLVVDIVYILNPNFSSNNTMALLFEPS